MTFTDLRDLALKILKYAEQYRIPYELHMYSAKIGYYIPVSELGYFNAQTKYIITFTKSAYKDIEVFINAFSPNNTTLTEGQDSLGKDDLYGFDVYQGVKGIKVFHSPTKSSKRYTIDEMERDGLQWLNAQEKGFRRDNPYITEAELQQRMGEVKASFKEAISYLEKTNDPEAKLTISRQSGTAHKMQVDPNTGTKRVSYRNLVLVFSQDEKLPQVQLPQTQKDRKPRSDSIAEQYKLDSSSFKFYKKTGIFEFFDK